MTNLKSKILVIGMVAVASLSLYTCEPPEPFPNTPDIEFHDLKYVDVDGAQDSLILSFDFKDGDGNLGLHPDERGYPFHDFDVIVHYVPIETDSGNFEQIRVVTLGDSILYPPLYKLLIFSNQPQIYPEVFSDVDNRPEYSCEDYDTLRINMDKTEYIFPGSSFNSPEFQTDTVYIVKNPNRYNIFVDFYIDFTGDGRNPDNFELFEWEYFGNPFGCGLSYNGRFPILDDENLSSQSSLQGTINYAMLSLGWQNILRTRPFFIEFYIVDRSILNEGEQESKSNIVRTPVFTLPQLGFQQNQEE